MKVEKMKNKRLCWLDKPVSLEETSLRKITEIFGEYATMAVHVTENCGYLLADDEDELFDALVDKGLNPDDFVAFGMF